MNMFLGVIIICSALVADAIIGNYQEKIMKTYHVSNVEMVRRMVGFFFSNRKLNHDYFRYFIVLDLVF